MNENDIGDSLTQQEENGQAPFPKNDEIIDAEYELVVPEKHDPNMPEIIPFGMEGSVIPGVKPENHGPWRPMLFIGGPLDGQHIRMPADGRLHDHGTDVEFHNGIQYDIVHRYILSMMTFDGRRMMVYVYLRHIQDYHSKCLEGEQARRYGIPSSQRHISSQKRLGIS